MKDKNKKIKIKLFTLQKNDYIGLEDSIELKSRFYNVHCASEKGKLNKIRILDFIIFIASNHGLELKNINDYIKDRKNKIIERIHIALHRELNNNKRTIVNAISLALTSYEKRKKVVAQIKPENFFNIKLINDFNKNQNIIQKIKLLNQTNKNQNINTFTQYKGIFLKRKKSAGVRKFYFLNQMQNDNMHLKQSFKKLNWNFYDENENSNIKEKNKKKTQNNISSYILTTSNTDRKSKKNINKRNNNSNNLNLKYYLKNNTFSNKKINTKKNFPHYNFTTTTLYEQNYDFIKSRDSLNKSNYEKEILNMTGIYNTKREKSKTKLIYSNSKNIKKSKHIFNNNKFSKYNIYKGNKNLPTLSLLSMTNKEFKLKKNKNKSIPNINKYNNFLVIK